jgi:hypothetical protein
MDRYDKLVLMVLQTRRDQSVSAPKMWDLPEVVDILLPTGQLSMLRGYMPYKDHAECLIAILSGRSFFAISGR